MIILYPLIRQSDYTEFKYSLRSIEKHLQGPYVVCVAGEYLPDWLDLSKVVQLYTPDRSGRKQLNIKTKVLAGLRVAETVLFLSDDIYLLQPLDPLKSPYFTSGTLKTNGESGGKLLMDQLQAQSKPIKNYDCHSVIRYGQDFKEAIDHFHVDCIIKSAYGNYFELPSVEMPDFKVNKEMKEEVIRMTIERRPYFSTGPAGVRYALPILQELFPNKSKFEL